MERNEVYKSIINKIASFQEQLKISEDEINEIEQRGKEVEREIEEHFEKCLSALITRKAMLLSECMVSVYNYRRTIEETQISITESIEKCKKILEEGEIQFRTNIRAAESIWKNSFAPKVPLASRTKLKINLPSSFMDTIQNHGEITLENYCQFTKADFVSTLAIGKTKQKVKNFVAPRGMCWNPYDNCLYFCDSGNSAIKKVTMKGEVNNFLDLSNPFSSVFGDHSCKWPQDIVFNHTTKAFFLCCKSTRAIYKISSLGKMKLFSFLEEPSFPCALAIDQSNGDIYVSYSNHTIKKITAARKVQSVVENSEIFNFICGLAFDGWDKSLLICDYYNNQLKRVSTTGEVSTICEIPFPNKVAITVTRAILVSSGNGKIYCITKSELGRHEVSVLAGSWEKKRIDGIADESAFNQPMAIVVHEALQTCFVSELGSDAIRKISFV